jgi:glycosyltransferase involved in cell wall biosynthesis
MKYIVMLSTASPGGMAQVVSSLRDSGLFEMYPVRVIWTHDRGSVARRLKLFLVAFAKFLGLLVTGQVSLVHAHVAMRGSFWRKSAFLWVARLFGRPIVVHLHGSQFEEFYERESGKVGQVLICALLRAARVVIVLSESWQAYVCRIEPKARVRIVHNFVDLQAIERAVRDHNVARKDHVILFLGEIGSRKGIYDLVAAMPKIRQSCPGAQLIAGGTGEIEKVSAYAQTLGAAEMVELPGWVSGSGKTQLLAEASVYVLPSRNENFPVSILEAMAAGLPVVSTPVGGIPDMIRHGKEGFLVQPGDVEAIAEFVGQLLKQPDVRQELGTAARRRIALEFSAEDAVRHFTIIYSECGVSAHRP